MKKRIFISLLIGLIGMFIFMTEVKALPRIALSYSDGNYQAITEDDEGECYIYDKETTTLTINSCTGLSYLWVSVDNDHPVEPNDLNIVVNGINNIDQIISGYTTNPATNNVRISSITHGILNTQKIMVQTTGNMEISGSVIVNTTMNEQGAIVLRGGNLTINNAAKLNVYSTADRMIYMGGAEPGSIIINNASLKAIYTGNIPGFINAQTPIIYFDTAQPNRLILTDIDENPANLIGCEPIILSDITKYTATSEVTEDTRTRFQVLAKEYDITVNIPELTGGTITTQSKANKGEVVQINDNPVVGNQIRPGSITVKTVSDSTPIAIDANNTFIMPAEDVVIDSAIFEEANNINIDSNISNGKLIIKPTAAPGEIVNINVKPNSGYVLVPNSLSITDSSSNQVVITNNTFAMPNSDVDITAAFSKEQNFSLFSDTSATEVVIPDKILIGVPTQIFLSPPAGREYMGAYLYSSPNNSSIDASDYVMTKEGNVLTLTLNKSVDAMLSVRFTPIKYDIIPDEDANGSFFLNNTSCEQGESINVWVTADNGYRLKAGTVIVTDESENEIDIVENEFGYFQFTMPDSDVYITAEFERAYEIDGYEVFNYAWLETSPNYDYYLPGEQVTLNIIPYPGYQIKEGTLKLMQDQTEITITNNTFTMPSGDVYITAEFEEVEIVSPVITARSNNYNKVEIEWESLGDGAIGYEISYATSKTGKYTVIGREPLDAVSYTHTGLTAGKTYYYKVRAVGLIIDDDAPEELYSYKYSEYSNIVSVKTVPLTPTVSVAGYEYNSVKISWDKVEGASGYALYRATSLNGKYSLIKTTSSLSYTNSSLSLGKTYYYKVKSYKAVGRSKIYSDYSNVTSQKVMPSKVSFSVKENTSMSLKLSWSKVSGATYYQMYICTSNDVATCTKYKTTKSTSYVMNGLTLANEYFYNIQACRTYKGKTTCGLLNDVKSNVVKPAVVEYQVNNTSYTSLELTFNLVNGANKYRCNYKLQGAENYEDETAKEVTEGACAFTGLTTGATYDVYVESIYDEGEEEYSATPITKTIKVVPATPIAVVGGTATTNEITWNEIEGATSYEVYRSSYSYKSFTKVATVDEESYTNTGLSYGKTYYYKVRAVTTGEAESTYGAYSNVVSRYIRPITPTASVVGHGYNSIKIGWDKVSGASGYAIYRATSQNGKYSLIKTTSSLSYTNSSLSLGKTYYYKVRAYKTVGRSKIYSYYSNIVNDKVRPSTPTVSVQKDTSGTLKLSWSKVSGATYYQIYTCSSNDTATCTKYKTTKSTSYIVSGLTLANEYFYNVQACRTYKGKTTCGDYSEIKYETVSPAMPKVTITPATATSLNVSWNEVAGANKYSVAYRIAYAPSGMIEETTETSMTLPNLITGESYEVIVQAIYADGEESYESDLTRQTAKVVPNKPEISASLAAYNKTKLNWDVVENATSYEVYRSSYSYKSFTKVATVTTNEYTSPSLSYGKTYYYKVVAVVETEDYGAVKSSYSNVATGKVSLSTPQVTVTPDEYNSLKISYGSIPYATGYQIYRATSKSGYYSKIATVTNEEYVNTKLSFNKTYYYKVRAYVNVGSKTYYSSYSSVKYAKTNLSTPSIISSLNYSDGYGFEFDKVLGATGYRISRKVNDGKYVEIKKLLSSSIVEISTGVYVDSNVISGNTYTYKVEPYRTVSGKNYYGSPVYNTGELSFSDELIEWNEAIASNTPTVTILKFSFCGYCSALQQTLDSIRADHPYPLYSIVMDEIPLSEYKYILNKVNVDFEGAPHTIITQNNVVVDELIGSASSSVAESFLTNNSVY